MSKRGIIITLVLGVLIFSLVSFVVGQQQTAAKTVVPASSFQLIVVSIMGLITFFMFLLLIFGLIFPKIIFLKSVLPEEKRTRLYALKFYGSAFIASTFLNALFIIIASSLGTPLAILLLFVALFYGLNYMAKKISGKGIFEQITGSLNGSVVKSSNGALSKISKGKLAKETEEIGLFMGIANNWRKHHKKLFILLIIILLFSVQGYVIKWKTNITLDKSEPVLCGKTASISGELTDNVGNPLGNKEVKLSIEGDSVKTITSEKGRFEFNYKPLSCSNLNSTVSYSGGYGKAASETNLELTLIPLCTDGTERGKCSSNQVSYLCDSNQTLVFDCSKCGCSSSLVCSNNQCITQEAHNNQLISDLQQSVVKIEVTTSSDGSGVSGSGVILDNSNGETVILTNKHVVADALGLEDVGVINQRIETANSFLGVSFKAKDIKIAPEGVDLAIIYVNGNIGPPVSIKDVTVKEGIITKTSDDPLSIGSEVLVLGSPLGIQGSVSSGIVSNFGSNNDFWRRNGVTITSKDYRLIQTDAAINHGNSGGGMFLKSTGELVGINTLTSAGPQSLVIGINYAIDITSLLLSYSDLNTWPGLRIEPKCALDRTPYNKCSTYNPGFRCRSGNLVQDCSCGCPDPQFPYCRADGKCWNNP